MKAVIAASIALILTACGGGGGDSGTSSKPVTSSSSSANSDHSLSSSSSSSEASSSSSSQAQVLDLPIGSGTILINETNTYVATVTPGDEFAPQEVEVTPGYDWTHVSWNTGHGYPKTEIWRSDQNWFESAEKFDEVDNYGSQYADDTTPLGSTYYYWVRFIGEDGHLGPFASVDGHESVAILEASISLDNAYVSADIDPDGYVIAARANSTKIDKIDLLTGSVITLFDAPEPMKSLAISPDGDIVMLSAETHKEFPFTDAPKTYGFSMSGEQIWSSHSAENFSALDFDKNGRLIAFVKGKGIRELSNRSGNNYTQSSSMSINISSMGLIGDIDISSTNELRLIRERHDSTLLQTYSIDSGDLVDTAVIQSDEVTPRAVVYR